MSNRFITPAADQGATFSISGRKVVHQCDGWFRSSQQAYVQGSMLPGVVHFINWYLWDKMADSTTDITHCPFCGTRLPATRLDLDTMVSQ
ncbi:MAG: hypothetical protein ACYTEQ_25250 [Planctomycetota bacterium]|jgi:hypothetical protein